ncbi:SDR family oxidoreductase [Agathobaculum sp. TL06]
MNYLITGGRGFIGCHIMRQLKQQGHNVICIAHNLEKTSMHEVLTPEEIAQITIIEGQLNDLDFLIKTIQDHKIEKIIHEGAMLGDACEKDPIAGAQINIVGTMKVFEAARLTGVKRVVWASSQSIFGTPDYYKELYGVDLIPNDVALNPKLVYGGTKTFCEFIAKWYYENYGLETIGLRYCMVFGVGRQRGAGQFATELINKPAMGLPGVVENGDTAPCWIYADDAARATIIASQCPNPKTRNFTIGGDITSLADIRDYILTLLPDAQIELKPGVFPSAYNLDVSQAEKELGFKCEYSVFEGVRKTINIIREKRGLEPV